jgi:hypothetical protein
MLDTLAELVRRVFDAQPVPHRPVILAAGVLALVVVALRPLWSVARNVITIAHEGGHALAAVLTGRRLSGIRLHSDTSGLTVSRGLPNGPGMVITGLAGYLTPPLLGMLAAGLLAAGRITLLLWMCLVLLPAMLVMIRNVFGVVSVVATAALIFIVSWYAPGEIRAAFAYAFAWFLLIGGVRAVYELQQSRHRRLAPHSDADQIGHLTRVPAIVWVGVFAAVALVAFAVGTRWLLAG